MLPAVIFAFLLLAVSAAVTAQEYARLVVSTRRTQLRVNGLVRFVRDLRATGQVLLLSLVSWPHLLDVQLKMDRTPVALAPKVEVWRHGAAVLWRYLPTRPAVAAEPVLLVHSLVTRPWVLDLSPGRSLVEALRDAGRDVWLLEWGSPGVAQAQDGLEQYGRVLWWAEDVVARTTGAKVDGIGYCAGGLLALAVHAALGPGRLRSLAVIAAPVDTQATGGMGVLLRSRYAAPGLLLDGSGLVPPAVVREAFHSLKPQAVKTMRRTLRSRRDPAYRTAAGGLGRWAWQQTPVPGALMMDVLDVFRGNTLLLGGLRLGARDVRLERLAGLPLLAVTTVRDHIVPPASTMALAGVEGLDVEQLQCAAGHVAMLAGGEAHRVLYPGLLDWLARR